MGRSDRTVDLFEGVIGGIFLKLDIVVKQEKLRLTEDFVVSY